MKRASLAAGLAVAGLLGGGMTLVFLWTGPPPSTGSPPAPSDEGATPAAAPVAAPPATLPPARAPGKAMARASWSAPTQDPSAPPMASRVLRKIVRRALLDAKVQSRLARCAGERAGGFGGPAAPGPVPRGEPALLVLDLESLAGEVRIVGAEVREWGAASEATVSCARDVLRGQVIAAPAVGRGERTRMPFPLSPRGEAVASAR